MTSSLTEMATDFARWMKAAEGEPPVPGAYLTVFSHLGPDGARAAEIARRAGVTRQAVGQTIRQMEAENLVKFVKDPDNKRAKLVKATPKGHRLHQRAHDASANAEALLVKRIGAPAARSLRKALSTPRGAVR